MIKKTGSEIIAQSKDGHIVKRNVSHSKRINKPREEDTDDEGFDYEENSQDNQPSIRNENNVVPRRSSRIRRPPNRYGHALPEIWDKMATDMRTLIKYGDQILL